MSLRLRLTLALALLAAASVVAVATTNYLQTSDRLHEQLDVQLQSDMRPLLPQSDPPGLIADQFCRALATHAEGPVSGYAARVAHQLGTSAQCIDASGAVTGKTGNVNLPVTAADRRRDVSSPVLATRSFHGKNYRTITITRAANGTIRTARDLTPTEAVLASIRERSAFIGLGVIALAALGGWLIASRVARPIARLTEAAEEVAATGRLDHPVAASGSGEVRRLASAFTSMLRALDESRAQQQRLVQDASHELRTPLTSLRTNLDTLRRHAALDPKLREQVLTDLDGELQELGALTTDLVQLTVEAHATEVETPVSLDQFTKRAAVRAARRSGREISVDAAPTTVVARPDAIFRAISNLLDNAIKFSPDGSAIEVKVSAGRIEVRDHGPGIDPDDLPFVFDRFFRAIDARGLPGSGLGLSIARAVVEGSGGSISAENDPAGGAKFTIVLSTTDRSSPTASSSPA